MTYTLRHTWPDDPVRADDYVFSYSSADVGRCYLRAMARNDHQWSWTIYIGLHVFRTVEGVAVAGFTDTLGEAKAAFQASFEKLRAAGVVRLQKP